MVADPWLIAGALPRRIEHQHLSELFQSDGSAAMTETWQLTCLHDQLAAETRRLAWRPRPKEECVALVLDADASKHKK